MTKERLVQMGLSEEQADKVMDALNGAFVTKSRFNEVNTELQTARQTIKERDSQLEALKKSTGDTDALRQQITQLQTDNAQKDKDHAAEIRKIRVENAVESALRDAGAINPTTVRPLLAAFLEKADVDDDGKIRGLADEIGKLAKAEGTAFLFRTETSPAAPVVAGASPAGGLTQTPDAKASAYQSRLEAARKAGDSALAVSIKREAAADGVQLY